VVDELGVLKEGQVYVQIDQSLLQDCPKVIQKPVIVAKNPCFHPGDVRLLQVKLYPTFLCLHGRRIPSQVSSFIVT